MKILSVIAFLLLLNPLNGWTQDIRPNVILLLVDDLGWSDIGCNGNIFYETPNVDSLARQSIFFTNASVSSPYEDEVRQSLFSGCFPVNQMKRNKGEVNLPEAFKRNGYALWHIGQGINGERAEKQAEFRNFDAIISGITSGAKGDPSYLVSQAQKLIQTKETGPFFLNLWFHGKERFQNENPALADYFKEKAMDKGWIDLFTNKIWCPDLYVDMPVKKGLGNLKMPEEAYYASYLSHLDSEIGNLLDYLKSTGEYENTIIVFTTDDGGDCKDRFMDCNAPLRGAAGEMFEGGVRVPLFIHFAASNRIGQRCNQVVILEDVFPTLSEICGLPVSGEQYMDGRSLAEVLKYRCEVKRDAVFWHFTQKEDKHLISAIRCCDWKYIYNHTTTESFLFHLGKDVGESINLVQKFPLKVACMQRKLNAWFGSIDKNELLFTHKEVVDSECEAP